MSKLISIAFGILFTPTKTAKQIKEETNIWPPIILYCSIFALLSAGFGYYQPFTDPTLEMTDTDNQLFAIIFSVICFFMGIWIAIFIQLFMTTLLWFILRLFKVNLSYQTLFIFSCYLGLLIEPVYLGINFWIDPALNSPDITGLAFWIPSTGIVAALLDQVELSLIWESIITFFVLRELANLTNQKAFWVTTVVTLILAGIGIALY